MYVVRVPVGAALLQNQSNRHDVETPPKAVMSNAVQAQSSAFTTTVVQPNFEGNNYINKHNIVQWTLTSTIRRNEFFDEDFLHAHTICSYVSAFTHIAVSIYTYKQYICRYSALIVLHCLLYSISIYSCKKSEVTRHLIVEDEIAVCYITVEGASLDGTKRDADTINSVTVENCPDLWGLNICCLSPRGTCQDDKYPNAHTAYRYTRCRGVYPTLAGK